MNLPPIVQAAGAGATGDNAYYALSSTPDPSGSLFYQLGASAHYFSWNSPFNCWLMNTSGGANPSTADYVNKSTGVSYAGGPTSGTNTWQGNGTAFGPGGQTATGALPVPVVSLPLPLRNPLITALGQTREITASDALNVPGQFFLGGSLVAPFVNAVKVTANYVVVPNVDTFIILNTTSGTLTATLPDPTSYNGPMIAIGCTGTGGASGAVATAGTSKTITGSTTVAQGSTRLYTRLSDGSGWWQS